MRSATRSFTLPPGLANSHFMRTSHPVRRESDSTRCIGVFPIMSRTLSRGGGRVVVVVVEEEEGGSVVAIHRSGAKSDDAIALEMLWRETPPSPSRRFSDENSACATPAHRSWSTA